MHGLHIPKTGGNALRYALGKELETDRYVVTFHMHDLTLRDVPKGDFVFFILRDPVTRFVSGFYSRKRQGQPKNFNPWTPGEKAVFEEFSSPNEMALALTSEDVEKKARATFGMDQLQWVTKSYWYWFENEAYFRSRVDDIIHVGFQERLVQDFAQIKAKLELPQELALPKDDLVSHRNPKHLDKKLDPQAEVNLRQWYKADYDFIELCNELQKTNLTDETPVT